MRYAFALLLLVGCAEEDAGPPRIETTVKYGGSAQGALVVAAFPSNPPMGAPTAVAQQSSPAFPTMLVLDTVEPGTTLYVLALLDVAPASPQQPGPEDRTTWSSPIVVGDGANAVTLVLSDP
jgi:hypothetical protein